MEAPHISLPLMPRRVGLIVSSPFHVDDGGLINERRARAGKHFQGAAGICPRSRSCCHWRIKK